MMQVYTNWIALWNLNSAITHVEGHLEKNIHRGMFSSWKTILIDFRCFSTNKSTWAIDFFKDKTRMCIYKYLKIYTSWLMTH